MHWCSRSHPEDVGSSMTGIIPHCADLSTDHMTQSIQHAHFGSLHIYCNHGRPGLLGGVVNHQQPGNSINIKHIYEALYATQILLPFVIHFYFNKCTTSPFSTQHYSILCSLLCFKAEQQGFQSKNPISFCIFTNKELLIYLGFSRTSKIILRAKASWDGWTSSCNKNQQKCHVHIAINKFQSHAIIWMCNMNAHHLKKGIWRIMVVCLFVLEHQPVSWAHNHSLHIQNRVKQPWK